MKQSMPYLCAFLALFLLKQAQAEVPGELIYNLKGTIVKVRSVNQKGGKSLGTGVVVAENQVATNCHVIADAIGMDIGAMGERFDPVGLQADWRHDICILNFQFLPLKPAKLADNDNLHYEDQIFSIGFPGGAPKPLTTFGAVKALYPFDNSQVIRISNSFQLGASGSPVFNQNAEVVAISTFKSPGRNALYYNMPVKWVKEAMKLPIADLNQVHQAAFWEADLDKRPYWMQIVIPLQNEEWPVVEEIANKWILAAPQDQEAKFYHALVLNHSGRMDEAKAVFKEISKQNPQHQASITQLADIAQKQGNLEEASQYRQQLAQFELPN